MSDTLGLAGDKSHCLNTNCIRTEVVNQLQNVPLSVDCKGMHMSENVLASNCLIFHPKFQFHNQRLQLSIFDNMHER